MQGKEQNLACTVLAAVRRDLKSMRRLRQAKKEIGRSRRTRKSCHHSSKS